MLNVSENELVGMLQTETTRNKAFSILVKTYGEQLYWLIRKIVLSHEDANDVLQNTFLKVWTNLDSFRGESKLITWLYRIATNESITYLNKLRSQNNIPIDDSDKYLSSKLESDVYFDGDEAQMKLQKAVLSLPEKQRLVFNMKYFEEMKYEEISDVLDTSVGALKASYHHAVKKIEDYLSNLD
jgi:RNA polymerase sigma-70 factor (ECF subfamily)